SGVGIGHAPLPDELGWRGVVARPHEPRIDIRYVVAWSTTGPAVTALLDAHEEIRTPATRRRAPLAPA
ncbi:MAG: hypothetical protein AAF602_31245, partial [Myxococcota bacterium]